MEFNKHGKECHESTLYVKSFVGYHSNGDGKSLKREILRLADSLRMTMLIAWSVTSLKVELQELGSRREGGES